MATASAGEFGQQARELVSQCVTCGFCLLTCPTYALWHDDKLSPRGRVQLTRALIDGRVPLDAAAVARIDTCLGCMACLTQCPREVRHDVLLELTRAHVEEAYRRPLGERALRAFAFAVLPHPRRLRAALALAPAARRLPLPRRLRPFVELAPPRRPRTRPPAAFTRPVGVPRARVGLLSGCVQSVLFADVNAATVRLLAAEGCEVVVPAAGCCGALGVHAGRLEEGLERARRTIDAFAGSGVDLVVSNAAGCGSTLKDYGRLLENDAAYAERAAAFSARVRDLSEALVELGMQAERRPLPLRVAWQDPCHLRHAQRVKSAPRDLLRSIPELELLEPAEQDVCCGSAGIHNLVQPDAARELGDRKAAHVAAVRPDVYASANPGCLLQVSAALRRAGTGIPALHLAQLLDASVRGVGRAALLGAK